MARKHPTGTKRFRERARRERQEEKARRRAARRAAKDGPEPPPNDAAPETEAGATTDLPEEKHDVADREPVPGAESYRQGPSESADADAARRSANESRGSRALTVTRGASELLLKLLAREQAADGVAVRLSLADDGSFSLSLDSDRAADETFAHDGRTVLIMEPAVARRLENETLDVEESPDGWGLMFTGGGGRPAGG